jgi:hypothetical protein
MLDSPPVTVIGPGLSSIRHSIGTENPIPEEMDHREIAVRVPVMNEVKNKIGALQLDATSTACVVRCFSPDVG